MTANLWVPHDASSAGTADETLVVTLVKGDLETEDNVKQSVFVRGVKDATNFNQSTQELAGRLVKGPEHRNNKGNHDGHVIPCSMLAVVGFGVGTFLGSCSGLPELPGVGASAGVDDRHIDPVRLTSNVGSDIDSGLLTRGGRLPLSHSAEIGDKTGENASDSVVATDGCAAQRAAEEMELTAFVSIVFTPAGVPGRRVVSEVNA